MVKPGRPSGRIGLLVLGMAAAGAVAVPAASAWANPPGCSNAVSGGTTSLGLLHATATGSCSANATRTMRVEIRQDIQYYPDPLLSSNSQSKYGASYSVSTSSCDHGQTAVYYGRGFFTTDSTQLDTAHTRQHTCT